MQAFITSDDPATSDIRDTFLAGRMADASAMIRRGIDRGEMSADTDPLLVLQALIGPLHFRALILHHKPDQPFISGLINLIVTSPH